MRDSFSLCYYVFMIYTLTLNPSLDVYLHVEDFQKGSISRSDKQIIEAGGKGINVSIVLSRLGYESTALGFTGGFSGDEIIRQLNKKHIRTDFVRVKGNSRLNIKIRSAEETDINGNGPVVSEENLNALLSKLDQLEEGDVLVMSGSIPSSLCEDIYARILKRYKRKNLLIVLDTAGKALKDALKYHPFLIKPNAEELGQLFHTQVHSRLQAMEYARRLKHAGAQNVLVSLGGDGAVFIAKDGREYSSVAPQGDVVNTTGAGDSMVAGFLAGYLEKGEYTKAFHYALCAGSAAAFSRELANKENTEKLYERMKEVSGWMK